MWGIVWDKVDGTKKWLDKSYPYWWADQPTFPYRTIDFAKEEAKYFVDIRIISEDAWRENNSKTGNDSLMSFFSNCTSENCCAKCSAPLPCKYHS